MTTSTSGLVSVVLPVHDAVETLAGAIESVLAQTHSDLELLVVDDGSTDGSLELARRCAATDPRVLVIAAGRVGLVAALNLGVSRARGEWLARMDADDVSAQHRFATQIGALERDDRLVAVGSDYRALDESGSPVAVVRRPRSDAMIRASFPFGNPLAHPTAMIAVDRLDQAVEYREHTVGAEDLDLWIRLAACGRLANVPEPLLDYRVGAKGAAPDRGRRVASFVVLDEWVGDRPVVRWALRRTYNPVAEGLGIVPLLVGIVALNGANLVRPIVRRRDLVVRSAIAVATYLRGRFRSTI